MYNNTNNNYHHHHQPDHSLRHLLKLGRHWSAHGCWVRVEDDLGTRVFPEGKVGVDGQLLDGGDTWFAVVVCEWLLDVRKGLLNGLQLAISVCVHILLLKSIT